MLRGLLALAFVASCAPRPTMCVRGAACPASPSLEGARRFLLPPTDVAFVQRSSRTPPGTLPTEVTLGRAGDAPAAVLLRYAIPPDLELRAAYLLVDLDGAPEPGVGLHAERIVGPWDAGSATWRDGPELRDVQAPSLLVSDVVSLPLRIDVLPLFRRPHGAEPPDQGVALVADRTSSSGVRVVLVSGPVRLPGAQREGGASLSPPRLELYVK